MFIAMNRFKVREGREADFEASWRSRDTYIQGVEGFVAFALLKNEPMPGGHGHASAHGESQAAAAHGHAGHEHGQASHEHAAEAGFTEYVSHTTWRSRADFDAWRQSEAFRQAHAQGSVEGVLMGPPVASIYEAVMEEAVASNR
jgi:heme-degrading monooxygenase HmoA